MLDRILCPAIVGRDEPLFVLEDALLGAYRGDNRFVALGGEAGMGKTRLATEVARRARRLDCAVLWGSCSEAELPLPYLPIVEALGNYLSAHEIDELRTRLGAAARELAQLFPQFAGDQPPGPVGDPAQAKLRLFEAVVALLAIAADERGALLVIEDVHWADSSTRELLDHLARRLANTRSVVLVTYRSDELDRRHPLTALLQSWRRSGVADIVTLAPLGRDDIAAMIAAILDTEDVGSEFRDLMHLRTEGNPFVLEEMLKETIDRGDVFRSGDRWERRAVGELRVPETVRDTILLRFARLDAAHRDVLEAASVLGRTFDYETLLAAATQPERTVHDALAVAVGQQLLENVDPARASYRWRHALTQEAIADEIVLPRRQAIHARAAAALASAGARQVEIARHLLGAARFDEAVPVCIAAADEAEASLAFSEALELLDRAIPHVRDPLVRARLLCRMGRALWLDGRTAAAEAVLEEGTAGLDAAGEDVEAARYRLVLGRCRWEQSRPDDAFAEFDHARRVLEEHGPSPDLAVAYMRVAGQHKFQFDHERALAAVTKAVETAKAAGAEFERIWAESWLALSLIDTDRVEEGLEMLHRSFTEALGRGYTFIAHNIAYNDAWTRLHTMTPGIDARTVELAAEPGPPVITDMAAIATSWAKRIAGDLRGALTTIEALHDTPLGKHNAKVTWRVRVELAEVLLELGRTKEAAAVIPSPDERAELQDIVYDAAPQIRLRLAEGRIGEAVVLAREIAQHAATLGMYRDTIGVAVEAFVAAGLLDEAEAIVDAAAAVATTVGEAFLAEARGRILLARGAASQAEPMLAGAAETAATREFKLNEWRARMLAADAAAMSGRVGDAEAALARVVSAADAAHAGLIADEARAIATRRRLSVPEPPPLESSDGGEPEFVGGERLVTCMFADVRGYTSVAATSAPEDVADRIGALQRWAAAEVKRHHGFVDKFAGDAVMATFNATGARLDHTAHALESAFALHGKAQLLELGIGIGIAVGPAIVGRAVADANVSVLGSTTNLAARLQAAANRGEILLSDEAHRRVAAWLEERAIDAVPETLALKGFDAPQPAWRISAGVAQPV